MKYPYSNEEIYKMFRDSNEPNFVRFLEKLENKLEKLAEKSGDDNEEN